MSTVFFFFFNDTATTEIYTLSLHDALPISCRCRARRRWRLRRSPPASSCRTACRPRGDRKSTRLNSSHLVISYAVFCLKKKKTFVFYHDWRAHGQKECTYVYAYTTIYTWRG